MSRDFRGCRIRITRRRAGLRPALEPLEIRVAPGVCVESLPDGGLRLSLFEQEPPRIAQPAPCPPPDSRRGDEARQAWEGAHHEAVFYGPVIAEGVPDRANESAGSGGSPGAPGPRQNPLWGVEPTAFGGRGQGLLDDSQRFHCVLSRDRDRTTPARREGEPIFFCIHILPDGEPAGHRDAYIEIDLANFQPDDPGSVDARGTFDLAGQEFRIRSDHTAQLTGDNRDRTWALAAQLDPGGELAVTMHGLAVEGPVGRGGSLAHFSALASAHSSWTPRPDPVPWGAAIGSQD